MKSFVYGTLAFFGVVVCVCGAAPEPAAVPGQNYLMLDVTFEHPQQIVLESLGTNQPRRFWYMIMTLTNKTRRDVDFYPTCELMTDGFQIVPAGKNTPPEVFEYIKKRHQSKYQFLEPVEKAGNRILQGQDNAKDIAVIWPDFDLRAKSIEVFVAGLSNETAVVDHPIAKDEQGNPRKVYLRKTLQLSYSLRSDPALRSYIQLTYKGKRWVMR